MHPEQPPCIPTHYDLDIRFALAFVLCSTDINIDQVSIHTVSVSLGEKVRRHLSLVHFLSFFIVPS